VRAYVLRNSNGNQFIETSTISMQPARDCASITISNGDQVYLLVYGTGFRGAGGDISATVGGINSPVLYGGSAGECRRPRSVQYLIPPELAAGGPQVVSIVLTAAGQPANSVAGR